MSDATTSNGTTSDAATGPITIDTATASDLAAVAELRWRWVLENEGTPVVPYDEFVEILTDWAAQHAGSHSCTVARRGATVIGMAWLAVVPRVPSARALVRASGDVQSVYVTPTERGSGVGGRMLDAVLRRAFGLGLERVTVHSTPGAITAYTRAGFASSDRLLQAMPES
ncbi:GNAT family N-acetyltransferase [Cryobacterium arcticum]|uniref:GNAT family N-acetyltransferase n=1 Tax=Cryobacterium arcticum TaxID=670052 RepID=A0A317ZQE1_9MICO|nr:GNAT family N-acetyltransferase [Cryobacterium arcticum]PXA67349.1 GNAT family N-acetyltransferase [Cryobacterium arcticum]